MKKIAIIYSSIHHNNTENLVKNIKGIDIYKINEENNINLLLVFLFHKFSI